MGGLGLLVSRSLRSNRRTLLGLALVVALAGGVALTSLAAARRTGSAFPRYLEASDASELAVNVIATDSNGTLDRTLPFAELARSIDGVESDDSYIGLEGIYVTDADGQLSTVGVEALGSLDGRFLDSDRVALTAGRLPREDALDEVFVNQTAAAEGGLVVGSTMHLMVVEGRGDGDPREAAVLARLEMTVVGIGLFPDEVLADDFDRSGRLLATPATTAAYLDVTGSYFWQGLHLAPSARPDDVIADYEELLDDGFAVNVQRTDEQIEGVQRGIRPLVAALASFGLAAAVAALVLGCLGATRLIGAAAADTPAWRAVGVAPRQAALAVAAPAVAAGVLGALGAAVLAVALSPLSPVGPVRAVEPARGVDVDLTVLSLGGLLLATVLVGAAVVTSRLLVHRQQRPDVRPAARSRLVDALAAAGLGPIAVIGTRHAVGHGSERRGVPTRSTLVACALSVTALTSALTFGAGVRQLLREPARYGWAAEVAVESGGGYERMDPDGGAAVVDQAGADVTALMVTGNGHIGVAGQSLTAMGIIPVSGPPPVTVLEGRLPATVDEIALGRVSARDVGAGIGDQLTADAGPLTVVGLVAMPAIGPLASSHPSLGQGALLTYDGLAARDPAAFPGVVMARLAPGVDVDAAGPRLRTLVATEMTSLPPEAAEWYHDLRPAEVAGLSPARSTANLLAGVLGIAAVLALAFTLSASVRRRARTYAVLSTLGFDRAGVRRTVRWQTNVVAGLALLIGLPLGIGVGRWSWSAFARQLGVASAPTIPVGLVALTCVAILVVANLAGEPPARAAARHSRHTRVLQSR